MFHKLLERQLRKFGTPDWNADPAIRQMLDAVNDSYLAYERDKELSEHAFMLSQEEFSQINQRLKAEIELRKLSISRLKESVAKLNIESQINGGGFDDDLLVIVDLISTEIARRQEAEKQMMAAKEEAEKASQAKSEFLSVMSHEIRTPLNAVIGMGHLLLKNNPRPDQLQNLTVLKKSADSLLILINDILDFNKIEAGMLQLEESDCNLKAVLNQVVDALRLQADDKNINLTLQVDDHLPDLVVADSLRLQQVLTNLCSNAVKFTNEGTVNVKVVLEEETSEYVSLHISVRDTGVGIDPAMLPQLFQPFMQASSSITRRFGGTGLGLAITKRLLQLMHSDIRVESTLTKGSNFHFTLQLKKSYSNGSQTNGGVDSEFNLGGRHILLVEDTPFNVLFASQLLQDWNAVVEVAEHGGIAVEKLKQTNFDLVLMDLQMPVMDGYTATREIRKFNQQVPIMALTASATSNVREKVLEVGMQDYVTKPFHPDEFYFRLKKLL